MWDPQRAGGGASPGPKPWGLMGPRKVEMMCSHGGTGELKRWGTMGHRLAGVVGAVADGRRRALQCRSGDAVSPVVGSEELWRSSGQTVSPVPRCGVLMRHR